MMYGMYGMDLDSPPDPTHISRFRVIYYDSVNDEIEDITVMAFSQSQCRAYIDTKCPASDRQREYPEGLRDSLQIIQLPGVSLPFIL